MSEAFSELPEVAGSTMGAMSTRRRPIPEGRAVVRPLLWMLLAVLLTAVLGRTVVALPLLGAADRELVVAVNRTLGPISSGLAQGVDVLFGPPVAVALLVLAVLGAAVLRRRILEGARAGILIVVPWGVVELLKAAVGRPRPEAALLAHRPVLPPDSFSFPSGHTAFAAALCCAVLLLLRPGRGRRIGVGLAIVVVAITAWSRVALGVHHPSDVLASAVLVPILARLLASLLDVLLPERRHGAAAG